ncbi:TonB-dependent receptor [Pedobacter foliorum]|uniref:TonB-dependent receptor n=1 Tax=Pedobacter foliorum TaxID=2739058 RepID=UPI001564E5E1|nr:TonB-dependent receptor [Pedobacter foliorum]NRF37863.1 TonB-dependent receptor [Pedobacter foliorum]
MKRSLLLLFFLLGILAFVPKDDDPIEKLLGSLQHWSETNPQEKVYLHTDKPYYALGDTIWFKAYVTIGSRHQLSALSGALYVDLINERDSIQQTLKLPVTAGMAIGDFVLSDTLNEGNYRLRSYTQWMRNAGEDYFFDRTFMVGNAFDNEVIAKVDYQYKTIENKPAVVVQLNYRNEGGEVLSGKGVNYEIVVDKEVMTTERVKTDADGNIVVSIFNDPKKDLKGAYLQTTIKIDGKKSVTKTVPIKAVLSQSDVQFFPESGSLVNGITSRVGFKAVGVDGLGLPIKGVVKDSENKEVVSFESFHVGMGMFNLKPESGKSYHAVITYPDGSEMKLDLPKAINQGYVLAVYQTLNDSLLVRINASADQVKAQEFISLIAQSGGEVIYGSQVKVIKSSTSVWLQKKDFPTGIAQFTLFNGSGEPLNERIVFVKNPDLMELKLNTVKDNYTAKGKVEMELEALDSKRNPVIGNFSLSVINETKVPYDEAFENTLLSNTLLNSDLKGYIEKPGYYFAKETENANQALDNLMLTQGYRRFVWSNLVKENKNPLTYKAEQLTSEISGKVLSLGGKPIVKGKVTLLSLRAGIVRDTITDESGRFNFDQLVLTDSIKLAVQARRAKNGKNVEVILDSVAIQKLTKNKNTANINANIWGSIKEYLNNSKKQDEALANVGGLSRTQRLKEVNIQAKKIKPIVRVHNLNGPDHYDQIIKAEELKACATLAGCLEGRLTNIILRKVSISEMCPPVTCAFSGRTSVAEYNKESAMLIVLDGIQYSPSDGNCNVIGGIFDFGDPSPADIESIEVLRTPGLTNIYGNKGMNGVILINTRRGGSGNERYTPSIANISPKGFNKARLFYSPRYDQQNANMKLPDLRSTIYWNPILRTGENGKVKFDFFNADGSGVYKVVVEGINAAGELGRLVYRYRID